MASKRNQGAGDPQKGDGSQASAFKTGDVVTERAGGPDMTVDEVTEEGAVSCKWFVDSELHENIFLADDLVLKATASSDAAAPPLGQVAPGAAPNPSTPVRVISRKPNTSHSVNGFTFALVEIGGETFRISERLPADQAERFCGAGYELWTGNEDEHARAIEDALVEARKIPAAGGKGSTEADDLRRQLTEQQHANQGQAQTIRTLRKQVDDLTEANVKLSEENGLLKAAGIKAA